MGEKCKACNGGRGGADGQCPVCCDSGSFEPVGFPGDLSDKARVAPSGISTARQIIECLMRENRALREERGTLEQNAARWRNIALASIDQNERQSELMDEMDRLLFQFLSGRWKN